MQCDAAGNVRPTRDPGLDESSLRRIAARRAAARRQKADNHLSCK